MENQFTRTGIASDYDELYSYFLIALFVSKGKYNFHGYSYPVIPSGWKGFEYSVSNIRTFIHCLIIFVHLSGYWNFVSPWCSNSDVLLPFVPSFPRQWCLQVTCLCFIYIFVEFHILFQRQSSLPEPTHCRFMPRSQ